MLQSHTRTYTKFWARTVLVSVALSAVLVARNVPPIFPAKSSIHSAVNASAHHDQRPRFAKGLQWSSPTDVFLLPPPITESARTALISEHVFALQTKGFHYNRPPPLS